MPITVKIDGFTSNDAPIALTAVDRMQSNITAARFPSRLFKKKTAIPTAHAAPWMELARNYSSRKQPKQRTGRRALPTEDARAILENLFGLSRMRHEMIPIDVSRERRLTSALEEALTVDERRKAQSAEWCGLIPTIIHIGPDLGFWEMNLGVAEISQTAA